MTTSNTKTSIVNNESFTLTSTYSEMDDQVLMHLADQMLSEMGGSRCVNSEIEFILKHAIEDYENAPFGQDDITNSEPTGEFEDLNGDDIELTEEEKETLLNDIREALDDEQEKEEDDQDGELIEELESLLEKTQDTECENYPEVMQWFALDERLIYRLEEMGECTLSGEYWGRKAYGQAITMDHCIKKVCYDLALCWSN